MSAVAAVSAVRLRTVFISDVHLGTKGCRADLLLEFLKTVHADTLVLVGDIIDVWSLRKNFFWPQAHNNVIRTIQFIGNLEPRTIPVLAKPLSGSA